MRKGGLALYLDPVARILKKTCLFKIAIRDSDSSLCSGCPQQSKLKSGTCHKRKKTVRLHCPLPFISKDTSLPLSGLPVLLNCDVRY